MAYNEYEQRQWTEDEFALIIMASWNDLVRIVQRRTGTRCQQAAEEIVQEAVCKLLIRFPSFTSMSLLQLWKTFWRAVWTAVRDSQRKNKRIRYSLYEGQDSALDFKPVIELLILHEEAQAAQKQTDQRPDEQRDVLRRTARGDSDAKITKDIGLRPEQQYKVSRWKEAGSSAVRKAIDSGSTE